MQTVNQVVYPGQRVLINPGVRVQPSVINAHTHCTVALLHEQDWVPIFRGGFPYPTFRQQIVNLLTAFCKLKRGHTVLPIFGDRQGRVLQVDLVVHLMLNSETLEFLKN